MLILRRSHLELKREMQEVEIMRDGQVIYVTMLELKREMQATTARDYSQAPPPSD